MAEADTPAVGNRGAITVCVILATLAVIPLRIVFRKSSGDAGADHVVMGE